MAAPFRYERNLYNPPAPVLPVTALRPPGGRSSPSRELFALCDTGVDISCIPLRIVSELALAHVGEVEVAPYEGPTKIKPVFAVALAVPGIASRVFRVFPTDAEETILGRDVLNYLRIQLDGPGERLRILKQKTPRPDKRNT